jgi:hypothetical protein
VTAGAKPCPGCGADGRSRGSRVLSIRRAEDLRSLTRSYGRFDGVSIKSAAIDTEARGRWEDGLLSAYSACGCDSGGLAVGASLLCLLLLAALDPGFRTVSGALVGIGLVIAAAVVGKALGIGIARIRLRRQVKALGPLLVPIAGVDR